MKNTLLRFPLLLAAMPVCAVYAASPAPSAAGQSIVLNFQTAELCTYLLGEDTLGPKMAAVLSPLVLTFPAQGDSYTVPHPHNNKQNTWPPITVTYVPDPPHEKGLVYMKSDEFACLITLYFGGALAGHANMQWTEDELVRHVTNATFTITPADGAVACVVLPKAGGTVSGDPDMLDDGLSDILAALQAATYTTATDKLYQKRLLMLLPLIMESCNPSITTPETKGNTALHYACALSHVQLVQWLIDHGAYLDARTDKGATVDACISGKNAKQIKKLLQQGREKRTAHSEAEVAWEPRLIVDATGAAVCANELENMFAIGGEYLLHDTWAEYTRLYAENLYSYVQVMKSLPLGVHPCSRVGKMALAALAEHLTTPQFCERMVDAVREELENKLDAQMEAASFFADAQLEIPGIADDVTEIVVTFDPACPAQPDVRVERRKVATHMKPYTLKLHFCGRVSLADGAEATVLLGPEYAHVDIAEPESRFDADIARHFGKHCRLVSYFMGNSCLLLYYTPEGEINTQRTNESVVPQDIHCVPVKFQVLTAQKEEK